MRIIKEGFMPPPKEPVMPATYTRTCHNCSTVYEFTKDDGTVGASNGVQYDLIIECPFCHQPNCHILNY